MSGYYLPLDYEQYMPRIYVDLEIGFRELWFYCIEYKSNIRVVWPVHNSAPINLERARAYLKDCWPNGENEPLEHMHGGKCFSVKSQRDGYETLTYVALLRTFDGSASDHGVLQHEMNHMAHDILEHVGYKFTAAAEEAFTYLSEYLFTIALDAIQNPMQGVEVDYEI